jgi:hypothetical protein
MSMQIIQHYYNGFNCSLEFIVKYGDSSNTYCATINDIDASILLTYCNAIIDFHTYYNTFHMNMYRMSEYHYIIDEIKEIAKGCQLEINNKKNPKSPIPDE